ncbi:MAG: nicotinate (nicotinamide) nucleotide adenylyltransferase [Lentisphaerae bacterium GWF2_57_35]|nr:MAG: nicotinate (nicotinamide) nucleotide adenylyltransferase [Lentisphaerae bacterium GWF2_57_35]
MKKIGIFGGSFNPVHLGHLILAQDALERFGLEKVIFIPCAQPPHKSCADMAAPEHRLAMLKLALKDDARMVASALEMERGGVSYTIDTLRRLKELDPEAQYYFIIGGDSLIELHTWKEIDELLGLCEVITLRRPGLQALPAADSLQLKAPWPEKLLSNVFTGHLVDISSTDIRRRVRSDRSIRYFVPFGVEMYIVNQELYRSGEK